MSINKNSDQLYNLRTKFILETLSLILKISIGRFVQKIFKLSISPEFYSLKILIVHRKVYFILYAVPAAVKLRISVTELCNSSIIFLKRCLYKNMGIFSQNLCFYVVLCFTVLSFRGFLFQNYNVLLNNITKPQWRHSEL